MPAFDFLSRTELDLSLASAKLRTLRRLGHPYTDEEIENAEANARAEMEKVAESLRGDGVNLGEAGAKSEAIALIAYLQSLGRAVKAAPVQSASVGGGQ